MSVMIGMGCGESARYSQTYASLMQIEKPVGTVYVPAMGMSIADNWNTIARIFLQSSAEWLFLVNDDHVYQPDVLHRLLAHDTDIVTGLYLSRYSPYAPVAFNLVDPNGGLYPLFLSKLRQTGLVPILACGDGALLIRRKVLEAIADPWWELGAKQRDKCDHDITFSAKVHQAGFQIYCDLDTIIGHITTMNIIPQQDENGLWTTVFSHGDTGIVMPAAYPIFTDVHKSPTEDNSTDLPMGFLSPVEAATLEKLAEGKRVLELGALLGRSTVCMARTAKLVVSVDRHTGATEIGHTNTLIEYWNNVRGVPNIIPIVGDFGDVAQLLNGQQFDMIFVDGSHDYKSVQCDLKIAQSFGGQIVAHDWDNFAVTPAATDAGFRPTSVVESLAILEYVGAGAAQSTSIS